MCVCVCVCVCLCVCGGGSAVLSLLFVYPEFPNTKLLAITKLFSLVVSIGSLQVFHKIRDRTLAVLLLGKLFFNFRPRK